MEFVKRQRSATFDNDEYNARTKKQIIKDETHCFFDKTVTNFEDLSNDVIHEIFDFLNDYDVYQAFFNLNRRFHQFLTNSTLPRKMNISLMSKSIFERYYTDIIVPNQHKISLLQISNPCIDHRTFSLLSNISTFSRLETLVIGNIGSSYLENLLHQLTSVPLLSSLEISSIDWPESNSSIYTQIFRLPALKYCKLSLRESKDNNLIPWVTNITSPIEHFVINYRIYDDQLNRFFSYLPRLRRLTVDSIFNLSDQRTPTCAFVLNELIQVSLHLNNFQFRQIESMIRDLSPSIEVLHLSMIHFKDVGYINTNRWEQLILSHMPKLRIFNVHFDFAITFVDDPLMIQDQMNQFTSSFWITRQCFFQHQCHPSKYGHRIIFYSSNPYRRKDYTFYKQWDKDIVLNTFQTNVKSVDHVHIHDDKQLVSGRNFFSNATKLTFGDEFTTTRSSIATILTHIIPLTRLTKLNIECHHFSMKKIIELLRFTPNVHTLLFQTMPLYKKDQISIEQSETFRLVSTTNVIRDVDFKEKCSLEKVQLLVALCPQLRCLTMNISPKDMEAITRFLLGRTNSNTGYLHMICFFGANSDHFQSLETFIKSSVLVNGYILKLIGWKLYLYL